MKNPGFTLAEVCVVLVLVSMMGLWTMSGLLAHQRAASEVEHWSQLAQSGRLAQTLLYRSLLNANTNLPCARSTPNHTPRLTLSSDPIFGRHYRVMGWEAFGTAASEHWTLSDGGSVGLQHQPSNFPAPLAAYLDSRVDPQSDVLLIYRTETRHDLSITAFLEDGLLTHKNHQQKRCAWMVISDCSVDLEFQQASVDPRKLGWQGESCQPGTDPLKEPPWRHFSQSHVAIHHRFVEIWFVGKQSHGRRSLFRSFWERGWGSPRTEEIVRGVESLQLEYASRGTNQGVTWQSAQAIIDWSAVLGVRFAVLASAPTRAGDFAVEADRHLLWSGSISLVDSGSDAALFSSAVFFRVGLGSH